MRSKSGQELKLFPAKKTQASAWLVYQLEAWLLARNSLNSYPDSGSQKKLPLSSYLLPTQNLLTYYNIYFVFRHSNIICIALYYQHYKNMLFQRLLVSKEKKMKNTFYQMKIEKIFHHALHKNIILYLQVWTKFLINFFDKFFLDFWMCCNQISSKGQRCCCGFISINSKCSKGPIISKYLRSKTIFINAKILILEDKISIFAFTKIVLSLETRYLKMKVQFVLYMIWAFYVLLLDLLYFV